LSRGRKAPGIAPQQSPAAAVKHFESRQARKVAKPNCLLTLAQAGPESYHPGCGSMAASTTITLLDAPQAPRCQFGVGIGLQRLHHEMASWFLSNVAPVVVLLMAVAWLCRTHRAFDGAAAPILASLAISTGIVVHVEVSRHRRRGTV
jgi:hypothetical protein